MNEKREADALAWVADALEKTGAFDAVYRGAFAAEDGRSSADGLVASVQPQDATLFDAWSGDGEMDYVEARVTIAFIARSDDGVKALDAADRLYSVAANALTRSNLGGLAMPEFTRFTRRTWPKSKAPEARIEATLTYRYLVDDGHNVDY